VLGVVARAVHLAREKKENFKLKKKILSKVSLVLASDSLSLNDQLCAERMKDGSIAAS